MKHISCRFCGMGILPGGAFYNVKAQIVAGSDGVISEPLSGVETKEFDKALKAVKKMDEQDVMADVFEEITFTLCPTCRRKFRTQIIPPKRKSG